MQWKPFYRVKMALVLLMTGIIFTLLSCSKPSGITRVWAIDDGEKIKKEDIANPLASDEKNSVWKNNTVNIFGGRNEFVAFQLIIQADASGAKDVNVTVSDLVNGSSVIPGSETGPQDPFDYRGRNTELFTEHYLNMIKRTPPLWFFSDSAVPPPYYEGWVPDCLIPFSAPPGKGGAPFSIEADKNQAVWVDILIPKNATPGIYKGKTTVTISNKIYAAIPIELNVYNFTLPDSTHIKNMFGYSAGMVARRHNVARGSKEYFDIELKYNQMAHRHRFDLVSEVSNLDDMTKYYKRYYTGESYSNAVGYAGPGENTGNTTFSIGYGGDLPAEYGGSIEKMNKADWWAGSDAWENWFRSQCPRCGALQISLSG